MKISKKSKCFLAIMLSLTILVSNLSGFGMIPSNAEELLFESYIYLSDMEWTYDGYLQVSKGQNPLEGADYAPKRDLAVDQTTGPRPITLNMEDGIVRTFEKGVGVNAVTWIEIDIEGKGYDRFQTYVGPNTVGPNSSTSHKYFIFFDDTFEVTINESDTTRPRTVDTASATYSTPEMKADSKAIFIDIDVTGVKKLTLFVSEEANRSNNDHANWADAKFRTYLTAQELAVPVETMINNLPTVEALALSDEADVVAARSAYDGLPAEAEALVSTDTLAKLASLETRINVLKSGHIDIVNAVEAMINDLPTVEALILDDEADVLAARNAYDDLPAEAKSLVSSDVLAKLVALENKIDELKVQKVADEITIPAIQRGDTKLVLPTLPAGYTLTMVSSSPEIISTDGTIIPAIDDEDVTLTFKVTKSDSNAEGTKILVLAVPGKGLPAVKGVSLSPDTLELIFGETQMKVLSATITPDDADNKTVTWESDNTEVVTVTNGVLTVVGEGTATITVRTVDGGFTDTCVVKVNAPSIILDTDFLESVIASAKERIDNDDLKYVIDSVKKSFNDAYNRATDILEKSKVENPAVTQNDLIIAGNDLLNTFRYLSFTGNKEDLSKAIGYAEAIIENQSKYRPASIAGLNSVLLEAETVVADGDALDEDIIKVLAKLLAEIEKAELKPLANKEVLELLLDNADSILDDISSYLGNSTTNLQKIYDEIKLVFDNPNATESEVKNAIDKLTKEIGKALLKPSKDKLAELINNAEMLTASDYTVASFEVLSNALASAMQVMENPEATAEQVEESETDLSAAMNGLVLLKSDEDSSDTGDDTSTDTGNDTSTDTGDDTSADETDIINPKTGEESFFMLPFLFLLSMFIVLKTRPKRKN